LRFLSSEFPFVQALEFERIMRGCSATNGKQGLIQVRRAPEISYTPCEAGLSARHCGEQPQPGVTSSA
jgi:hypothetical protein